MAVAVDGYHRYAVGHGVAALHGYPCLALALLLILRVCVLPAYGRWVNQQFRSLEGHQACGLGIPLVPAYQYPELAK